MDLPLSGFPPNFAHLCVATSLTATSIFVAIGPALPEESSNSPNWLHLHHCHITVAFRRFPELPPIRSAPNFVYIGLPLVRTTPPSCSPNAPVIPSQLRVFPPQLVLVLVLNCIGPSLSLFPIPVLVLVLNCISTRPFLVRSSPTRTHLSASSSPPIPYPRLA